MRELGIEERYIFVDKQSGKDFNRPQYQAMRLIIREGDLLYLDALDRLGRDYDGIIREWKYRLKSVKNYNANGALLDSYTYTYDANGNRTSVATNEGTISYQYNALNQLTQETLADGSTITYEYDAVGNRTKKSVTQGGNTTTTNYTYDNGNQLTAVNGQAYSYDANGNLTGNGTKTFIYDVENRLSQVKDSAGNSLATFTYDHDGKRTSMTTASGAVYFHYSGDKVIYETDANNSIIVSYTWDAQGNPVSMTKNGVTYYYHLNGHGDVTALTDTNGTVVAQYQYDAWGNITSSTGVMKDENPYRYAGYRYDQVTGLYYLMARYYDASVGRFITRDAFHGFEDDAQTLHQYAYTKNNPVMHVDPTGNVPVWVFAKFAYGGVMNSWDIAWNFYKLNKFNLSAWRYKFDWSKFVTAFVVGGVTEVVGFSYLKALQYYQVRSRIAYAINFLRTEAQKYVFNTLSRGESLSFWDMAKSMAASAAGGLGTFIDALSKL